MLRPQFWLKILCKVLKPTGLSTLHEYKWLHCRVPVVSLLTLTYSSCESGFMRLASRAIYSVVAQLLTVPWWQKQLLGLPGIVSRLKNVPSVVLVPANLRLLERLWPQDWFKFATAISVHIFVPVHTFPCFRIAWRSAYPRQNLDN